MKKQKVIAILPAYNATHTLVEFLGTLPRNIFDEVLLVDDCSVDDTFALAKKQHGIVVYKTPRNLGYGGNLKYCITHALARGADIIIELHPDGEYAPDGVASGLHAIKSGAQFVLGNRFAGNDRSIPAGMIYIKYVVTRVLTSVQNAILGTHIPDLHQGFRIYTRKLLEQIPWRATSDSFLFSFEIIVYAVRARASIDSVAVTARYRGNKRGAAWWPTIVYTLGTWITLMRQQPMMRQPREVPECPTCGTNSLMEMLHIFDKHVIYLCHICRNASTISDVFDESVWYPMSYFFPTGFIGRVRDVLFRYAQMRRVTWVKHLIKGGSILDVGSGSGKFAKSLAGVYSITNLDPYMREKPTHVSVDLLTWSTKRRFDAIVFWESLEHLSNPLAYLIKARSLLKTGGYIFIEYPRFQSLESRVFGSGWFHIDVPRHRTHFSDAGLAHIAQRAGFSVVQKQTVFAVEYAPMGLLLSLLRRCGIERYWVWFVPTLVVWIPIALVLYMLGQSPIGLLVAQKASTMRTRL